MTITHAKIHNFKTLTTTVRMSNFTKRITRIVRRPVILNTCSLLHFYCILTSAHITKLSHMTGMIHCNFFDSSTKEEKKLYYKFIASTSKIDTVHSPGRPRPGRSIRPHLVALTTNEHYVTYCYRRKVKNCCILSNFVTHNSYCCKTS
jgi:hypothetical protein